MANRYAVGGSFTWDASDTSHWSASSGGAAGASVPGASDAVIFDANSNGTITLGATTSVASINGDAFTGTLNLSTYNCTVVTFSFAGSNTKTINIGSGDLIVTGNNATIFSCGTTGLTYAGTGRVLFTYAGSSGTRIIATGFPTEALGAATIRLYFTGGTDAITVSGLSGGVIDFTGFAGTLNGSGTIQTVGSTSVAGSGSLVLSTGMTYAHTGLLLYSGTGNGTWDTKNKTLTCSFQKSGVGSLTLLSNITTATSKIWTYTAGGLITDGYSITCNSFVFSGASSKPFNFTNSTLTLKGTGTVWNASVTGVSITATGSTIIVDDTSATSKTLDLNGLIYGTITTTGDNIIITGSNTISTLNLNNGGRVTGTKLTAGTTNTITAITTNATAGNLAIFRSTSGGSPATLYKLAGYIDIDYLSLQDIAATGPATYYAGANSTNVSGNSGWIFTALPLKLFINDVDCSALVLWNSLTWKPAITNKVDTLSFSLYKHGSRTYAPTAFDEVLFYDGGELVFAGTIIQYRESISAVERQIFSITCKDRTHELDRRLVIERYTSKPLINIVCDILNRYVNKGSRIEIATFEPSEIWQGDGSADTTNFRVATQGRLFTSTNAVAAVGYRKIKVNLAPTGYTTSDYIECDVYVDDITKFSSAVIKLGDATLTNYFSQDISSQITATGWNFVSFAKSAFSSTGSPSWETVAKLQIEVTSTASNTVNVTFDNWQEVKTTAFTRNGANNATQTINYIACNYEEPSKVFQRLADLWQLQWHVDPNRDISFFARFENLAPFNLADDTGYYIYNSLVIENMADQIRNGIFVRGGDYIAGSTTEDLTQQADGANTAFLLGYKYSSYSATIGGVAQMIGIDNLQGYADNNGSTQAQIGGTALSIGDAAARTKQAQQVIVTATGRRSKIYIRLKKVGAPVDNFQVQIFSDTSNAPSGTNLSTVATLAGGSMTTSYVEYAFTLTAASTGLLDLTTPTTYHIVLSRSGANDGSNYYQVDAVTSGAYEGIPNTYDGAVWSVGVSNMYFLEKLDFDALYSFNEKLLTFNIAPSGASTILWEGLPYLPIIVRYSDPISVGDFGDFEYRIIDPSIKTQDGARQRANAELLSYAQTLNEVSFTTNTPGLRVGQTITIQSTIRGIDLTLIVMAISARPRSPTTMSYEVECALTRTMGIIYWLQDQIAKDSSQIVIDDNEIFDRVDGLSETVYASVVWDYALLVAKVWSNDAGTTPSANRWGAGAEYIWI